MAKFKVGDRVKSTSGNMLGTVVGGLGSFVSPDGDRNDYPDCVTVKWDSYSVKAPVKESNLILANSVRGNSVCSRNASAKIVTTGNFGTLKVGDRVDFRKSRYWRGTGVVTKVYGNGIIDVKGDNGEGEMEIHEEDIMNSRVRSTNSVVAKALNAVAVNVKSYPFYVVDKAMKGKCIFSGRYELSDANDDVAELKKSGVESKAVPRRFLLLSSGIDPDEESSWKKNHKRD